MEEIIEKIRRQTRLEKHFYGDETFWDKQESVIITPNEAQKIVDELKRLQHYRDSTVGLWATDRPDKVSDPDGVLFQLKDVVQ